MTGYGNIAPKTPSGRVFCIFYGLFGVPLCLTWISELGKFFGGRAKHLGQYLTKKGVTLVRNNHICVLIFLLNYNNRAGMKFSLGKILLLMTLFFV